MVSEVRMIVIAACLGSVGATAACRDGASGGTAFNGTIMVGASERTFTFFAPDFSAAAGDVPLLLVFHGGGSSAAGMQRISGFEPFARSDGFAIAYLDALFGNWAHGCDCTISDSLGVDDVAFATALIDSLSVAFPIDTRRIYAAGLSQGGLFVHRLACEIPGRFAAIGSVVAPMSEPMSARCAPTEPIAVLIAMGTLDPVIPSEGGGSGNRAVLGAQATADRWVELNGCTTGPAVRDEPDGLNDGTTTRRELWSDCAGGVEVALYTIEGGVHQWEVSGDRPTASFLLDFFLPRQRN